MNYFFGFVLSILSLPLFAGPYKCTVNGKVIYSQTQCAIDAEQMHNITMDPAKADRNYDPTQLYKAEQYWAEEEYNKKVMREKKIRKQLERIASSPISLDQTFSDIAKAKRKREAARRKLAIMNGMSPAEYDTLKAQKTMDRRLRRIEQQNILNNSIQQGMARSLRRIER